MTKGLRWDIIANAALSSGEPGKLNNKDENVQRQSTISGKKLLFNCVEALVIP